MTGFIGMVIILISMGASIGNTIPEESGGAYITLGGLLIVSLLSFISMRN